MQQKSWKSNKAAVSFALALLLFFVGKLALAAETCTKPHTPAGTQSASSAADVNQKTLCDIPCLEEPKIGDKDLPEHKIHQLYSEKKLTIDEMAKRLIFAETLASGVQCLKSENIASLVKVIAQTVLNRMNSTGAKANEFKTPEDTTTSLAESVLFKPKQFRSSFGGYDVAQRKAMLCPLKVELFTNHLTNPTKPLTALAASEPKNPNNPKTSEELWLLVHKTYDQLKTQPDPVLKNVYYYYLHRHYEGSSLESQYGGKKPNGYTESNTLTSDELGLRNNLCLQARRSQ